MHKTPLRALAAALTLATCAVAATSAHAGSIVFAKRNAIWAVGDDGRRPVQITHGGKFASPSQADNGVIVALGDDNRLYRLCRCGRRLSRVSTWLGLGGGQGFAGPYRPRVSPDGSIVAYTFFHTQGLDPVTGTSRTDGNVAYTYSRRYTPPRKLGMVKGWDNPSWLGNRTVMAFAPGVGTISPDLTNVAYHQLGHADPTRARRHGARVHLVLRSGRPGHGLRRRDAQGRQARGRRGRLRGHLLDPAVRRPGEAADHAGARTAAVPLPDHRQAVPVGVVVAERQVARLRGFGQHLRRPRRQPRERLRRARHAATAGPRRRVAVVGPRAGEEALACAPQWCSPPSPSRCWGPAVKAPAPVSRSASAPVRSASACARNSARRTRRPTCRPIMDAGVASLSRLAAPPELRPAVARWLRSYDRAKSMMRGKTVPWRELAPVMRAIDDGAWKVGAYRCVGDGETAPPTVAPVHYHRIVDEVVIDTDMGADDWMAILYLLQRPDVHVRAITVSGAGLAHCGPGVRNALRLLALAGKRAPVACGRARPRHFPAGWRRRADRVLGLRLPGPAGSPSPKPASELLAAAVRGSVRPVSLLTLGPLTNVADAFALDPRLARELRAVYVMGGAITAPGNTPDGASEWNFHVDPTAASAVLRSGAPITLVPLDATQHVPVTRSFYEGLKAAHGTRVADFVFRVLSRRRDSYFWDPLAAAILTDRLATVERRHLQVAPSGWTFVASGGPPVDVAVDCATPARSSSSSSACSTGEERPRSAPRARAAPRSGSRGRSRCSARRAPASGATTAARRASGGNIGSPLPADDERRRRDRGQPVGERRGHHGVQRALERGATDRRGVAAEPLHQLAARPGAS